MQKPVVAIVGRPNVGKSSFFNRVTGKRISIVEDTPGVTRDRIYADADWAGKSMTLVDTGGISLDKNDQWQKHILYQAELAIDMADVIVFILDGRTEITHEDRNVAQILRKSKKPVVVAVNKLGFSEIKVTFRKSKSDCNRFALLKITDFHNAVVVALKVSTEEL